MIFLPKNYNLFNLYVKIIILLYCLQISYMKQQFKCRGTPSCIAFEGGDNHCEYQCPKDGTTNFVIFVENEKKIQVDCYDLDKLNITILPKFSLNTVNKISLKMCPLPLIGGFSSIIEQLDIPNIELFRYSLSDLSNYTINNTLFVGMPNITLLSLKDNNLINVSDDTFQTLYNLNILELDNNKIVHVSQNLFKNMKQLEWLDLARNKIDQLPDNIFQDLENLKVLHLWRNQLIKLKKNTFKGLKNLQSIEFSFNKIDEIEDGTFENFPKIQNISLSLNKLTNLPENLFKNLSYIRSIKLNNNRGLQLKNYLFSNLTTLKFLYLSGCQLEYIPETVFHNTTNLEKLTLDNNYLETLPEDIFENLVNLKEILLNNNQFKDLSKKLFSSLKNLEILHLEYNLLTTIDNNIFKNFFNLKELYLQNNQIKYIHSKAFSDNNSLKTVNLAHNLIDFKTNQDEIFDGTPFSNCFKLQYLDISYNLIEEWSQHFIFLKPNMKHLDFSHNLIKILSISDMIPLSKYGITINLSYNNITYVDFEMVDIIINQETNLDARNYNGPSATIKINNNPFICDCRIFQLVQYFQYQLDPAIHTLIDIKTDNVLCLGGPSELKDDRIETLSPIILSCPINYGPFNYTGCPLDCLCNWRPYDKSIFIDCKELNLTKIPDILLPISHKINHTVVNLENNLLTEGPNKTHKGYENVSKLYLGGNLIKKINWLPKNLNTLQLSNNKLERLDDNILEILQKSNLSHLYLEGNPWICDCDTKNLPIFLRKNYKRVIDINHIKCNHSNIILTNLNENDLCDSSLIYYYILTFILIIFTITTTLLALYYRYQREIKVWLFARNLFLWWVTEDELDKEKTYDAFISYSHKDEDFVTENLIPILEAPPNPFKLCLHYRNWIPGEFIAKQVINSVKDSRRTIVILSPNFLESVWGKMEFRTAHTEAMSEGRARVIVVLYGDVDINQLDNELKTYLKTNTYVKWGDPWFWNKLKYALPHIKNKYNSSNKTEKYSKKMTNIDDKFILKPVIKFDNDLFKFKF